MDADLVYRGGRVYSMREEGEYFEAIAIRDGVIVAAGDDAEVAPYISTSTQVEDLAGRTAIPGFIDAHVHLEPDFTWRYECPAAEPGDSTLESVLEGIRRQLDSIDADGGWLQTAIGKLPAGLSITRVDLDRVEPARPLVVSVALQTAVLNSVAMEACGFLDGSGPVPSGGTVAIDASGVPTGEIRYRALDRLYEVSPLGSPDASRRAILRGLDRLLEGGVTSIHQVTRTIAPVLAYQKLAAERALPLRVGLMIRAFAGETELASLVNAGIRQGFGNRWLSFQGVKLSIDEALRSHGAMLREEYADAPGIRGRVRVSQDELNEFVATAHLAGLRCVIHCNGDGATDMALRAYERADGLDPRRDLRHRLEHVGNVHCSADLIERIRSLDVCAVPNPPFLAKNAQVLPALLGDRRAKSPLNFRDFIAAGARVFAASDFTGNERPLDGVRLLVTRTTPDGVVHDAAQAVSVWEAIRAYTVDAAWLGFEERWKGKLSPGFAADIAILSGDPFTATPDALSDIRVLETVVNGESRYVRKD
jgi:predicted amidohydrolase YtcJ